ncbi:MAG: hypothetical protein KF836_08165 [Fimbriimonadaceae bacterium]|nr:hypothetical protein [Fimbriimonadaceae bacterium]
MPLPKLVERYNLNQKTITKASWRQLIIRIWFLPAFTAIVVWVSGCILSPDIAQVLSTLVSVFSALFFAAIIPVLELRRFASAKDVDESDESIYWRRYNRYLGHVLTSVSWGLWIAFVTFMFLLLTIAQPKKNPSESELFFARLGSAGAISMVVTFVLFLKISITDVFLAYEKSHPSDKKEGITRPD